MDNECESNMPSSGRDFGHCIISWGIKNYGRALWLENLKIKTPNFTIKGPNSLDTKWKLILETELNNDSLVQRLNVNVRFKEKDNSYSVSQDISEVDFKSHLCEEDKKVFDALCLNEMENVDSTLSLKHLMLYLERNSDEGPDKVYVNWKVSYIGIKGEKVSLVQSDHVFCRKIKYGFNIGALYDFDRDFEYNSGLMTFLCDMIVTDTDNRRSINDELSIDLYGLSDDLQWIFDQQKLCDAEIKVDGKSVKAHKAMLSSHSEFFRLSTEKDLNIFELSDMKYNEVLKILEYMYSHDLKDVIGKPSVSVYDAAIQMNLRDLAAHYDPEEIKINTKIDVNILTYPWVIHDFTEKTGCISSSILKNSREDTAWQIHLYPNGIDGKSEYIELSVECIDGIISNDMCIQCAVWRNDENPNIWKNLQKAEDNNTIVRDSKFILKEEVLKVLNNDTLRLGFKVRTCSGKESSFTYKPCTPVLFSMKKSFEDMRQNMLSLRESNKYTDVTFNFGKKEIKAHKFILTARSHFFRKEFEEASNFVAHNISPKIFEIILDYIYGAIFNISSIDTVIQVYKSADELLIPRLQEKCSRFLQNNLQTDNVIRIFMLANECDDKYLKETTKEFMETNKHALEQQSKNYTLKTCETKEDKKKDDMVSAVCITKNISVIKYNETTVVKHDFEWVARPLNGNISQTKRNSEKSLIATTKNVSDEILECLEENDSIAETHEPIIKYVDYSSKTAQSDELNVSLETNRNDGLNFYDGITESKTNVQLQQDDIRYVHIDSKGNEIKAYSPCRNPIKMIGHASSNINASEQVKQDDVKEILQDMQLVLKSFQEVQKEFNANVAEKVGRKTQEPLLEQNESNLKSNIGQNESQKKSPKLDTTLKNLNGNGQEPLEEQKGNDLKSNVTNEAKATLNEFH